MFSRRLLTVLGRVLTLVVSGVLLVACGGSDNPESTGSTETPTTAANGTTLPGTDLDLGMKAVVSIKAAKKQTALVDLTVTSVMRGAIKDLKEYVLTDPAKASTVYYVRATVRNNGPADLGGKPVVLYGKTSDTLVVQPLTLVPSLSKCNYQPLPKTFKKGSKAQLCMVMLAPKHGKLSAIEWRAAAGAAPISWAVR